MVAILQPLLRVDQDIHDSSGPTPFVKWAGGKRKLMAQYERFFPKNFRCYHEPFLGGGAFFFFLRPHSAILSDINHRLIEAYQAIRDDLDGVLHCLDFHRKHHSKEHFYRCRQLLNQGDLLMKSDRAALMIYLNKTCFNGLYRENSQGDFNVPIGQYKAPHIYDRENLREVHEQLQGMELRSDSFEAVLDRARPGDFVYFDPPYVPISTTSSFTHYSKDGFDSNKQHLLADVFRQLDARGCFVMSSNSDCGFVREIYRDWRIEVVSASRCINVQASKRGAINELVIMNW